MNIKSSVPFQKISRETPAVKATPQQERENVDSGGDFFQPSESSFGPRVLGGFVGAVVGGIAGSVSTEAAVLASGLGAGVATTATLGSHLTEAVKSGLNGDPLNDVALTTSAIFAGGVALSSFSAAAGMGAYALDQVLPGSGRLMSAALGAAAGASIGIWN